MIKPLHMETLPQGEKTLALCAGIAPPTGRHAGKAVIARYASYTDSLGIDCRALVIVVDGERFGGWIATEPESQQCLYEQFRRLKLGLLPA